jgi:Fur family ferric uptake transcriptional regulator
MEPTWAHQLRAVGLRVTRPRLSVLSVLAERPHADADSIVTGARALHPTVSPQAVYGVLRALVTAGLARRIEPAGAPALFELRVGDNHHHLVCRSCGAVADVDCALGGAPCLEPSDAAGFVVDEAEVVFWGFCLECQGRDLSVAAAAESTQIREHEPRGGSRA